MQGLLLACTLWIATATTAHAAATPQVHDAWVQAAPPGATVMAAYLTIINPGTQSQTLVSVSSPDFAAVEIHTSQIINGTASMSPIRDLTIPPHTQQVFAPGAAHLMLIQPQRALRAGDAVRLRLRFSHAQALNITVNVK